MKIELPAPNSRVCFVGPTGSGKTFLAKTWLLRYKHVAILDPKQQFDLGKNAVVATNWRYFTKAMERAAKEKQGRVIYRPPIEELDPKDASNLDQFYEYCFYRGNTLTYCDELYYLTRGSSFANAAPWFFRCVTAGRSRGVGVWSAFQRPSNVPRIAMTETELRAVFYLRTNEDRKRVEESFGEMPWETLAQHEHTFSLVTDKMVSKPIKLSI